jgi:large subunit ribosomal protein L6
MSRIGKKLIELPAGVTLTVGSDNTVTVKGPNGELKQSIDRDITVELVNSSNQVLLTTFYFNNQPAKEN